MVSISRFYRSCLFQIIIVGLVAFCERMLPVENIQKSFTDNIPSWDMDSPEQSRCWGTSKGELELVESVWMFH